MIPAACRYKSSAWRRARTALDAGYLRNPEQRGRPARLVLGEPLPEEQDILPRPAAVALAMGCAVAAVTEGIASSASDMASAVPREAPS